VVCVVVGKLLLLLPPPQFVQWSFGCTIAHLVSEEEGKHSTELYIFNIYPTAPLYSKPAPPRPPLPPSLPSMQRSRQLATAGGALALALALTQRRLGPGPALSAPAAGLHSPPPANITPAPAPAPVPSPSGDIGLAKMRREYSAQHALALDCPGADPLPLFHQWLAEVRQGLDAYLSITIYSTSYCSLLNACCGRCILYAVCPPIRHYTYTHTHTYTYGRPRRRP
jgi:hypothetical protein